MRPRRRGRTNYGPRFRHRFSLIEAQGGRKWTAPCGGGGEFTNAAVGVRPRLTADKHRRPPALHADRVSRLYSLKTRFFNAIYRKMRNSRQSKKKYYRTLTKRSGRASCGLPPGGSKNRSRSGSGSRQLGLQPHLASVPSGAVALPCPHLSAALSPTRPLCDVHAEIHDQSQTA